MSNPRLNDNKAFIEQVLKCMYTIFVETTQPFSKSTLSKNNTSLLAFVLFYETKENNFMRDIRVFSCVT